MKTITIEMRVEDAEPILRDAAFRAAKYGGMLDHIGPRTVGWGNGGGVGALDRERPRWRDLYLKGKRMVEAFGVFHENTSEAETVGDVYIPTKVLQSHIVDIAGMSFRQIDKSEDVKDRRQWRPQYSRGVHEEASRQAADRVVRAWRAQLDA